MAGWIIGIVCITIVAFALLVRRLTTVIDSKEPPYIPCTIPLVGHLFGVIGAGAAYYRKLHNRFPQLGLYGLQMPGGRMYIVTSADWANSLEKRNNRSVSLELMIARVWGKIFGVDAKTNAILQDNLFGDEGSRPNLMIEIHDLAHKGLSSSGNLESLKQNVLKDLAPRANNLAHKIDGGERSIALWSWTRHAMASAALVAFYGPDNPLIADSSLMDDFWTWESSASTLMMTPLPSVFARKAYLARKRYFSAWVEYVERDGYQSASQFVRDRAKLHLSFGLSKDQYGLAESGMPHALLVNMIPSAFWLISFIFRDPSLLGDIRAEVDQCIRKDGKRCIVNVSRLQSACPVFYSTYKETLRIIAPLHTNRVVREDTLVTNSSSGQTYLMKKDSAVQYASTIIHESKDVWGEEANSFQPRRFLPTVEKGGSIDSKVSDPAAPFRDDVGRVHSGSFRAFGGGYNLCPGRHFATTQIMALAAIFIAGFDIEGKDGSQFIPPPFDRADGFLFVATIKPEHDVSVEIRRRSGWQDVEWALET